ncbi:tripartite motif containing 35-1 [Triplophysa dalaica]|uniref:tripartite motif containing 35-1 n=1 Tax=Triplophysa dalaica TaxID=1582913 RepID=UPI0024DF8868|nr:tripartite motif containing 35-1 [Triplophysa dalaica]
MSLEDELSCPVCTEVFSQPVLLSCGHSYCHQCITDHWSASGSRSCPVCRQLSPQEPISNLGLRNACETYLKERRSEKQRDEEWKCHIHGEKLQLFCKIDDMPICSQCKKGAHRYHNTQTLQQSVKQRKGKLKAALCSAEKTLSSLKNGATQDAEVSRYIQFQTLQTERMLKEEFKKLHQFLKKEEEGRIAALNREEKDKRGRIDGIIQGRIRSLSDMIREVEEEIKDNDIDFLQNYTSMMSRIECALLEPMLCSESLIDVPKHLGNLKYKVWKNMKDVCSYYPLALNPNTAPPCFSVSDDLTSVTSCVQQRENPNPLYRNCMVLGNVGYGDGVHTFTIEVGNSRHWTVGVCLELLGLVYGLKRDGDMYHILTSQIMFKMNANPKAMRVMVEDYYDLWFRRWRKVSFFDAKTDYHFAEISRVPLGRRLLPFVIPGERAGPLRVLPAEVTLTHEQTDQKLFFIQRYRICFLFCFGFVMVCFLYYFGYFDNGNTMSDRANESVSYF